MRWPARHLQELQPIIHGIAWAPMLQCGRSQTLFVLAKSIGSLSVNRIILSKVAASDLVLQYVEGGRHKLDRSQHECEKCVVAVQQRGFYRRRTDEIA